eukprot:2180490-Pleurochrysis_carterae.AAC.2
MICCCTSTPNVLSGRHVAATRHPRLWLRLHAWREEAWLLLRLLLDAHSLTTRDASFAEDFYNLRRVQICRQHAANGDEYIEQPLSRRQRLLALILLVMCPFFDLRPAFVVLNFPKVDSRSKHIDGQLQRSCITAFLVSLGHLQLCVCEPNGGKDVENAIANGFGGLAADGVGVLVFVDIGYDPGLGDALFHM